MENIALEILKYPDKCVLSHKDMYGRTALYLAIITGMENISFEILKHINILNYTIEYWYKNI